MGDFEILYPSDLGAEHYQGDTLPEAVNEPQFVTYECLCGAQHRFLIELIDCRKRLDYWYALRRANAMELQAA
jgi:hypothetical protein